MKLFGKKSAADGEPGPEGEMPPEAQTNEGEVIGERGTASVDRTRSVQSRVSSVLTLCLVIGLGGGLLIWYYANAYERREVRNNVQSEAMKRLKDEAPLAPLGRVDSPLWQELQAAEAEKDKKAGAGPNVPTAGDPADAAAAMMASSAYQAPYMASGGESGSGGGGRSGKREKTPEEIALERKLSGPVFTTPRGKGSRSSSSEAAESATSPGGYYNYGAGAGQTGMGMPFGLGGSGSGGGGGAGAGAGDKPAEQGGGIGEMLHPTVTKAAKAEVLPARRLLLPKGSFIDCTLETAIDTKLPGMTTCITATDTFSTDGSVVLFERGTKLVGETQGSVKNGAARIFVLWTEARTPTGIVVPLDSPATDELGRSGLSGKVNRHFFERFGAAILVSMIDGVVQAQARENSNGAVVVNPQRSSDIMTEILRSTVGVKPSITKNNGDRIQVFVARDLDFRTVYELRSASSQ